MGDINIDFCRAMLREVQKDVKTHAPAVKLRDAWVYNTGRDHWEFHGPDEFYWHGSASNAYEARYKGWCGWLRHKGVPDYQIGSAA